MTSGNGRRVTGRLRQLFHSTMTFVQHQIKTMSPFLQELHLTCMEAAYPSSVPPRLPLRSSQLCYYGHESTPIQQISVLFERSPWLDFWDMWPSTGHYITNSPTLLRLPHHGICLNPTILKRWPIKLFRWSFNSFPYRYSPSPGGWVSSSFRTLSVAKLRYLFADTIGAARPYFMISRM